MLLIACARLSQWLEADHPDPNGWLLRLSNDREPEETKGAWQRYSDPDTGRDFYYNRIAGDGTYEVPDAFADTDARIEVGAAMAGLAKGDKNRGHRACALMVRDLETHYVSGVYTVMYEGDGTLEFGLVTAKRIRTSRQGWWPFSVATDRACICALVREGHGLCAAHSTGFDRGRRDADDGQE